MEWPFVSDVRKWLVNCDTIIGPCSYHVIRLLYNNTTRGITYLILSTRANLRTFRHLHSCACYYWATRARLQNATKNNGSINYSSNSPLAGWLAGKWGSQKICKIWLRLAVYCKWLRFPKIELRKWGSQKLCCVSEVPKNCAKFGSGWQCKWLRVPKIVQKLGSHNGKRVQQKIENRRALWRLHKIWQARCKNCKLLRMLSVVRIANCKIAQFDGRAKVYFTKKLIVEVCVVKVHGSADLSAISVTVTDFWYVILIVQKPCDQNSQGFALLEFAVQY